MVTTSETGPQVGLRHSEAMLVEPKHTVPQVAPDWPGFADMPPAFATAMMIGFIEQACIQGLRPHLSAWNDSANGWRRRQTAPDAAHREGEDSVGGPAIAEDDWASNPSILRYRATGRHSGTGRWPCISDEMP